MVPVSRTSLVLLSFATALAIVASIAWIDLPVAGYFHATSDSPLVEISTRITNAGLAVWYLVGGAVLFLLCFFRPNGRPLAMQAAFIVVAVAASGIAADILKVIVGRTRPRLLFENGLFEFHGFKFGSSWNSFPSGHSTTIATMAVALCLLVPRWRLIVVPLGIALVATRFIVTAHFVSDTLAGSYLGLTSTLWVYSRFVKRGWLPRAAAPLRGQAERGTAVTPLRPDLSL